MADVTAVAMQKGGVGKTTTAINLSAGFSFGDYKTLLIDLDPQANATSGFGVEPAVDSPGIQDMLIGSADFTEVKIDTDLDGLDLLPSGPGLNNVRNRLPDESQQYDNLAGCLGEKARGYEKIIIDCPPALGPLTLNGFKFAGSVLIPLQSEYYALEGLSQLWQTIREVKKKLNSELSLAGIVLTMFDGRTNLSSEVKEEVDKHFPDRLLDTVIPRNVKVSEAPGYGKPVILHAPKSRGSKAYLRLTEEVIYRGGQRTRERT